MQTMRAALCVLFLAAGIAPATPTTGPATAPTAVPAAADRTRVLDLTVLDAKTGKPVAAEVAVWRETGEAKRRADADGRCMVEYPADAKYVSVTARAPGYVPVAVRWDLSRAGAAAVPDRHALSLEPGTRIGGRVVDDAGTPVAAATVVIDIRKRLRTSPDERVDVSYETVTTGPDGRWSFDRAPAEFESITLGTYSLRHVLGSYYPMEKFEPATALRDESATLRVERGTPVEGVVYAADGKPLAGAKVGVGADRVCSNVVPEFPTGPDGRFAFQAKPGEMTVVTVKADGHAPEQKQFLTGTAPHRLEFRLGGAKVLRGRVVDPAGRPIEGVTIYTDTWRGTRTLDERLKTDADGRFAWYRAPADAVQVDIYKLGYADLRNHAVTAGDDEVKVTLRKPMAVRGAVVDAESGRPVEAFRVVHGIAFGGDRKVIWQRRADAGDDPAKPQPGGRFEYTVGFPYPQYATRVEADGYLPADSRRFTRDEGDVVDLRFELKRGKGLSGVVRAADGAPAKGAQVVVATPEALAYIYNGAEVRDQGCVTTKADDQGRYALPPMVGAYTLVVLHAAGYAEVPAEAAGRSADVALQPWGRIEGVARVGDKPAAGADLTLDREADRPGGDGEPRIHHQTDARADDNGRFVFDRVRPGGATVSRTIRTAVSGNSWMNAWAASEAVVVEAGKTVAVRLGGTGRPVVGRLAVPDEVKALPAWTFAEVKLTPKTDPPPLPMPEDVKGRPPAEQQAWREAFAQTDAGRAHEAAAAAHRAAAARSYAGVARPDGAFRFDDVPAGTYAATVVIARTGDGRTCGPGDHVASAATTVTVPEMPGGRSDDLIELPTLTMTVRKMVGVGDPAPAWSAKTLDGKDLKLEDFRGKYVLVDFWATWCGPCLAETPNLKAVHEAYAKHARFAMVGLSLDGEPAAPRAYIEQNRLGWVHGFLGPWSGTTVPEAYGITGIPSVWLIGPDGRVVAKDLRGPAVRAAVEQALGKAP